MTKILATVDGSEASRAVLPMLTKLAKQLNAQVELLNVAQPVGGTRLNTADPGEPSSTGAQMAAGIVRIPNELPFAESKDQAMERNLADARDLLEEIAKSLREAGIAVDLVAVVDPDPAQAIADYAKKNAFDFIAMATHGRTGLSQLVSGSVASAVVRSGVAPVFLVRPEAF